MKIIKALITLLFAVEGITKLIGMEFQYTLFRHWGYPIGFMKVIGLIELIAALLIWVNRFYISWYATIVLLIIMVGAFYTHITRGDVFQMMGLVVIAFVLLIIHLVKLNKK